MELKGQLSRHEIRTLLDQVADLVLGFKIRSTPRSPNPGRRWWSVADRLGAERVAELVRESQAGVHKEVLADKYGISLSSVQRVLRPTPRSAD